MGLIRVTNRPHGTPKRGVPFERKMGTDAIVIVGISSEDLGQMDPYAASDSFMNWAH